MKTNVYVLCGGKSVEHDVSLQSAQSIINSINKEKYNIYPVYISNEGLWSSLGLCLDEIKDPKELEKPIDSKVGLSIGHFLTNILKEDEKNLVFPALHGPNGEDGTIQGFLELLDIPYVGNEVLASSLAMDKVVTKDLFFKHNIPQGEYIPIQRFEWEEDKDKYYNLIEEKIGYPAYVKPANSGSSVGISRVSNLDELKEAFKLAFKFDTKILIEKEIIAREVQVSILGNNYPKASLTGEFILEKAFFDYSAKYLEGSSTIQVPANINPETAKKVQDISLKIFKILNCHGLARVDVFVSENDEIFVNEVNTMPGFTPFSMTPALWKGTDGTSYSDLVNILIDLALERYEEKQSIVNKR